MQVIYFVCDRCVHPVATLNTKYHIISNKMNDKSDGVQTRFETVIYLYDKAQSGHLLKYTFRTSR